MSDQCWNCNRQGIPLKKISYVYLCEDCEKEQVFICHKCGREVIKDRDDWEEVEGKLICGDCSETHAFDCVKCNKTYFMENFGFAYGDYHEYACRKCVGVDKNFIPIRMFNYIPPKLNFFKLRAEKEPLFMGFELEVECIGDKFKFVKELNSFVEKNKIQKYYYFKEDCSLVNGFEIVTFPSTYNYMCKYFKLQELLEFLSVKVNVSYRCGLHIHVDRKGLGDKEIACMQYLAYHNREDLFSLSGRDIKCIEDDGLEDNEFFSYISLSKLDVLNGYVEEGKYHAIAERDHTVEFRLYRSTLNPERLLNNLKITKAMVEYVTTNPIEVVVDYPELKNFKSFIWKTYKDKQLTNFIRREVKSKKCLMEIV